MKASGLARIGRDAEVRTTKNGQTVVQLALAFTYGLKGEDGYRPTQWAEASYWGDRAAKLAPYLKKGDQVVAYLDDVHIETYESNGETKTKLVARCSDVELIAKPRESEAPKAAPMPVPRPAPKHKPEFYYDDIPF